MKFEYGRLSEKRNEEIENMQIINPFGELWGPRLSFKGIRVVKSEDEYYVFKHLIGGPNFYDAHPDEAYYLFVCKDKYYFITLGDEDYTREIVNEWKPHIENITIKIKKNNELSQKDVLALVDSMKIAEMVGFENIESSIKFKIIYGNKVMMKEF